MKHRAPQWAALLVVCGGAWGCEPKQKPPVQPQPPAPLVFKHPIASGDVDAALVSRGKALVAKFECNRCHDGTGLETPKREKHCVHCHRDIFNGSYKESEVLLKKWRGHIKHLTVVPSVDHMSGRFRRAWLESFLQNPHDVRPRLGAQMPRLPIGPDEAKALAAYLMPKTYATQTPIKGDAKKGRALVESKGCMTCHGFTGHDALKASPIPVEIPGEQLARAMKLAPDLMHTRTRYQPQGVIAWLLDPKKMLPSASMPKIPLTNREAADITAFLIESPLKIPKKPNPPKRLPVLTRPVKFDEVQKEVFRFVCWHCHSEGDYVNGDGGPGNTGGFGFTPRKLSLANYTSISRGLLDHQGNRMSVFSKDEKTQTPLLIRAMMARHYEVAGQTVPGVRGMPLGLPPMSLKKIQLVETWIAQGRPR